jgi:hypothetical protein
MRVGNRVGGPFAWAAAWTDRHDGRARMGGMRISSGKVVGGRVELDTDLPEGTSVTVLAPEGDVTFEADPETEKMLLEAIAQCQRGETTPLSDFLAELRSRE